MSSVALAAALEKELKIAEANLEKGFQDVKKYQGEPTMTDVIAYLNKKDSDKTAAEAKARMALVSDGCSCYPYYEWKNESGEPMSACMTGQPCTQIPYCDTLPYCDRPCAVFHCKIKCCYCCCNCCKSVGKECGPMHCHYEYWPSCCACCCEDESMIGEGTDAIIYKDSNMPEGLAPTNQKMIEVGTVGYAGKNTSTTERT